MGTGKVNSLFYSVLLDFWEGPRLHPFLLLVKITYNEDDCGALME
jgi:hypothetical protein